VAPRNSNKLLTVVGAGARISVPGAPGVPRAFSPGRPGGPRGGGSGGDGGGGGDAGGSACSAPLGASDEAFDIALTRKRHIEIATTGIDELLQTFGGDPYLGVSNFGLRVPFLATSDPAERYLFNLASFTLAEGQSVRIVGYRMFWSLGVRLGAPGAQPRFVEQPVYQPGFHLPDGNVSFHMHRIGQGEVPKLNSGPIQPPLRNFSFLMSDGPALLYQASDVGGTFYVNLTTYTPPNLGKPWGAILQNNLGTFYDMKTQWREHGAWHAMDVPVDGPCTVAFFASVRQTDPVTRVALTPPAPFFPGGLSAEEQFLLNFPFVADQSTGAIIWRVGGAFIVEMDA